MSKLSRRKFLQAGAAAAAFSALPTAEAVSSQVRETVAPHRRNVLFITVDDQNARLGCYGSPLVQSPHIDALAARGTRFEAAYCQYPWCGPSRASLLTGMAPDTTKVYDLQTSFRQALPNAVTLPQLFRKNGYFAARVGKIFHADVPHDIGSSGLDDPASWDYVFNPQGVDHLKDEPLVTDLTPQLVGHFKDGGLRLGGAIAFYEAPSPDDSMTDSLGADEVIRLLKQKRHQPFFLAYGLYRPHVPWIVPKQYFDKYPLESIEAWPFDPKELKEAPPAAFPTRPPNYGMDDLQQRKAIRAYYASTSFMDAQVGRVLKELKDLGLEKDTVVVLLADHGWSLGEHGQWEKQTVFESAARVPLVFAGPGSGKGEVCRRTVEHLDLYPTLAELCGLEQTPTNLHGKSLGPLLSNPQLPWDNPAISQVTRQTAGQRPDIFGYSLRNEHLRYTQWQGLEVGEELYYYRSDPHELRNLAADPGSAPILRSLREQLAAITARRGRPIQLGKLTRHFSL